jgi:uncharacterized protein (DUF1684 family)
MKKSNSFSKYISSIIIFTSLIFTSCGKNYSDAEKLYMKEIEKFRAEKNEYFRTDPGSPFNNSKSETFTSLNYFEPDLRFVFKSKLHEYSLKDTVKIFGTKGEERKVVRFGYLKFNYKDREHKVNVYEGMTAYSVKYYAIWFTDKTTNNETYGVGRYIDFDLNNNKDYLYTLDFNKSYNPYCAYNSEYSCAIPTKEDYLDLEITAGEKKYH